MISRIRDDIMGMPITVHIVDFGSTQKDIDAVFDYFKKIDNQFSTFKKNSEISKYNRGVLRQAQDFTTFKKNSEDVSKEMKLIFQLSEQTKKETDGFFDIKKADGTIDPSGLTKGWAIYETSKILEKRGIRNFYIEAGGDIQAMGHNERGEKWKVGIKNPFNQKEIIKIVQLSNKAIATSGTYIKGQHIYDPHEKNKKLETIVSVTVIGPDIYEADRFATAAFAMQEDGIYFLEKQSGLEGYMIDRNGIATMTTGFSTYQN